MSAEFRTVPVVVCAAILAALAIPLASVAAELIELQNGESFEVDVIEIREDVLVVQHPILGRLEIPRDEIKKEEEKAVEPGVFGTSLLRGWGRSASMGLSGSIGNAEDVSLNGKLDITRETDSYRGNFGSQYFYSSAGGITSKNDFKMSYLHDFLVQDSRWLVSTKAKYDFDDFQSWRHRLSAQLTPGYDLLQRDGLELIARMGIGVAYEFGSPADLSTRDPGASSSFKPEGVVSLTFKWTIDDAQTLEFGTTYLPDFKELPDFRLNSDANYKLSLGVIDGMSLELGLVNEYVSGQRGDNNSLNYYANLAYDF